MAPRVSIRPIDTAKLRGDVVLDAEDDEVRHIPHHAEAPRSEVIHAFSEAIEQFLREAYRPPMMKTHTHTGYSSTSLGDASSQAIEQLQDTAVETGSHILARTESYEPNLELEARPFFDRSATFLRLKLPTRHGRGYGRGQPFKAQDIQCWQRIRGHDWSLIIGCDIDVLVFVNHWFECDFTWKVLQHMFDLDPQSDSYFDLVAGDAKHHCAVSDEAVDGPSVEIEWECLVCLDEGKPKLNTATVPARRTSDITSTIPRYDFCRNCRTYRKDPCIWLCMGPPDRTWPRGSAKLKPCLKANLMYDLPVGVPCCPACETVRHHFQGDDVFRRFANTDSEDEPLPEKALRA